ncbi:conserved hypothetical protein [Xenorhabdus bovienii str. feltiae Florida]|nr:conserved hypothetical protein [Xenorhabdus bovienii str. feltiae Florida]
MHIKLITQDEIMEELGISSRQTLWDYENRRNFPKPVGFRPKKYLRTEYETWLANGGASQSTS